MHTCEWLVPDIRTIRQGSGGSDDHSGRQINVRPGYTESGRPQSGDVREQRPAGGAVGCRQIVMFSRGEVGQGPRCVRGGWGRRPAVGADDCGWRVMFSRGDTGSGPAYVRGGREQRPARGADGCGWRVMFSRGEVGQGPRCVRGGWGRRPAVGADDCGWRVMFSRGEVGQGPRCDNLFSLSPSRIAPVSKPTAFIHHTHNTLSYILH